MIRRNEIMEEAEKHMYDWGIDVDRFDIPDIFINGSMECIDAMIGAYGKQAVKDFCKINAFKYLWRLGHKNAEEQEVGKIKWYLDKYIELNGMERD